MKGRIPFAIHIGVLCVVHSGDERRRVSDDVGGEDERDRVLRRASQGEGR